MMKQIKIILAIAFVNLSVAQHNTTGKLEPVVKDGMYEIKLPNEIRSFSNRDLSDFRIVNTKGKEVPYFIRDKRIDLKTSEYVTFDIVSRETFKDSSSSIVFQNPFKTIQEVVLTTANYSGIKSYKVLGSNNLTEWYGVLNTGRLTNIQSLEDTSVDKTIVFPSCSYKYLKILFNDKSSLPINILKVGGYINAITNRALQKVTIESLNTVELNNEKKTQIQVRFKNKEIINQIRFKISAPKYFNRTVTLYKKASRQVKNKEEVYNKQLARFQLNSEVETVFNLPEIFEETIYIDIENKDSNNLTFTDISFFQKPLFVITSLKANETYTIKTGSKTTKAPDYDLSFFRNNISENLPVLEIKNIERVKENQIVNQDISFWQKSWFMWVCIVITGGVVLYFTSNLVKDLKKD